MTQTTVPPVRVGARVLALVVAGIGALSLAYACAETKRSLGDECLKDQDCLSGICSQLVCAAAPPLIDAMVENPEAGESSDSSPVGDAPADSSSSSSGSSSGADTGSGDSSSGSSGGDGAPEASSGD
jgi:uncharacterized membrane protein YgcG